MVGTPRCEVPARETAGGNIAPLPSSLRLDATRHAARTAQRAVPTRTYWEKAMGDVGCEEFRAAWSDFAPNEVLRKRAESLARGKYSQATFNARR